MHSDLTSTDIAWIAFLSNIGYIAVAITAIVAGFCVWMWRKPTDKNALKLAAQELRTHYEFYADDDLHFKFALDFLHEGRIKNETFTGALSMVLWLMFATAEPICTALFRRKPFTVAFYYLRWKFAECAKYQQVWAVAIWIGYMTAGSMLSLYLYSLHPPCEARNDCAATEERGIDIGRQHE